MKKLIILTFILLFSKAMAIGMDIYGYETTGNVTANSFVSVGSYTTTGSYIADIVSSNYVTANSMEAQTASFDVVNTNELNAQLVSSDIGGFNTVTINLSEVQNTSSDIGVFNTLTSVSSTFNSVTANSVDTQIASVDALSVNDLNSQAISSDVGGFNTITANLADIQNTSSDIGVFNTFTAINPTFNSLEAQTVSTDKIQANYSDSLSGDVYTINRLNSQTISNDVATINSFAIQDRFITVKDYTAEGIQNAIDTLVNSGVGGEIYLPSGTYNMTVTANGSTLAKCSITYGINLGSNKGITLRGAGTSTVISGIGSAPGNYMFHVGADNVKFKDITFWASDNPQGGVNDGYTAIYNPVAANPADNLSVENCNFYYWVVAIDITRGSSARPSVKNCRFYGGGGGGAAPNVSPNIGITIATDNGEFIGNFFFHLIGAMSIQNGADNNVVANNFVDEMITGAYGFRVVSDYNNISGNRVRRRNTVTDQGPAFDLDSTSEDNLVISNVYSRVNNVSGTGIVDLGTGNIITPNLEVQT